MFLKSVEGKYEPSFFIIRLLNTKAVDESDKNNESTFVHEYIHFLQDLFLPYCIRENLVHLATFFDLMDRTKNEGEIRLPVGPPVVQELTTLQTAMTWGEDNKFVSSFDSIKEIEQTECFVEQHGYNLHQYDLSLGDGSSYQFGARDLLEYIACKIESKHYPAEEKLPDLPYYSVDIMIKHFGASYLNDFKRIALAEYCLQNDNPAHRLIMFLIDLKIGAINTKALASDESFSQYLRTADWVSNGVPSETITKKLSRRSNELSHYLQLKFPEGAFPAIYSWLQKAINYARKELAGKSFFAELWAMDTPAFLDEIDKILKDIGIPLIANDAGELKGPESNEMEGGQFLQLLLAYEFQGYLKRDTMQCPMIDICERGTQYLVDEDCMDAPFRKALSEDLCPFGAFAATHGLDKIRWYVKDKLVPSVGSHWR